jgi:hypothetical protein
MGIVKKIICSLFELSGSKDQNVRVFSNDQICCGSKMSGLVCWMLAGLFLVVTVTSTAYIYGLKIGGGNPHQW